MFTEAAYFVFGLIIGGIVAVFQYAAFIVGITRSMKEKGKFGGTFAGYRIICEIEQAAPVRFLPDGQLPLLTCKTPGCVFRGGHHGGCADAEGNDLCPPQES